MPQTDLSAHVPAAGVEASEVAAMLGVDLAVGLSQVEADSRLQTHGANRLAAPRRSPGSRRSSVSTGTSCRSCCWRRP